jgi:hypothetical protein
MHTNKVLLALKSVAFSVVIFDAVKSFTIYNVVLQNASVSATSAPSPSSVVFAPDEVRIVSNAFLYLFLCISLSCRTVILAVATALLIAELAAMPAVELVAPHYPLHSHLILHPYLILHLYLHLHLCKSHLQ